MTFFLGMSSEQLDRHFANADYRTNGDYKQYLGRVAGSVANYLWLTDEDAFRLWVEACWAAIEAGE